MASSGGVAIRAMGVCSGLAILCVGATLPIWTTWYFCPLGAVGHPSSLWQALGELPANIREANSYPELWATHQDNHITGGLFLALASGVAWAAFRAAAV